MSSEVERAVEAVARFIAEEVHGEGAEPNEWQVEQGRESVEVALSALAEDGSVAVLPGGRVVDHPDTLVARILASHDDPDSDPGDLTIMVQDDSALTTVHQESHRKPWEFTPGGSIQEALTNHLRRLTGEEGA